MAEKVIIRSGTSRRDLEVIDSPHSHVVVESGKELHGWWPGKRECTSERMLINPYNGCSVDCLFCYAKALPGYFQLCRDKGVVIVCQNYDRVVAGQLDRLEVAACGYLSPVTDPFQPVNDRYGVSERIIEAFVSRNIPVEFITKERIPEDLIEMIRTQAHSFGQISILTPHEPLRRQLMQGGANTDELFANLSRLSEANLHAVCRIDPVIPFVTDSPDDLRDLVTRATDCGVRHVVTSVMDICLSMAGEVYDKLTCFGVGVATDLRRLYRERIDNSLQADINYRKRIFDLLRNICDKAGLTFALCMEYEMVGGVPVGLNAEFMSSRNCEGIDIPVYVKSGSSFEPAADCSGACLTCTQAKCGIDELALGRLGWEKPGFKMSDYRRWSGEVVRAREGRAGGMKSTGSGARVP